MKTLRILVAAALMAVTAQAHAVLCTVTEHRELPRDANGQIIQVPNFPPLKWYQVDFTAAEATADPFTSATYYIGFVCNNKAHFQVAAEGAATTGLNATAPWVPVDTWFFIEVPPGYEIAFYDGTT